jgi:hypothetical protein
MGSLQTPPGHPGHSLALITAKFGDLKIAVAAPDADLKVREGDLLNLWRIPSVILLHF